MTSLFDNKIFTFVVSLITALFLLFYLKWNIKYRQSVTFNLIYPKTDEYVPFGNRERQVTAVLEGSAATIRVLSQQEQSIEVDWLNQPFDRTVMPAEINVGNLQTMLKQKLPADINIVRMNLREVKFQIDRQISKKLPISIELIGMPAEGFEIKEVELAPKKVTISGAETLLKDLEKIVIGSVDVSGAHANVMQNFDLNLDAQQDYWVQGERQARAVIKIQEKTIQKDFKVSIGWRSAALKHEIVPPQIQLTVEGPYSTVQALTPGDFSVYVDAQGLTPGFYRKPVALRLPVDVLLVDNSPRMFSVRLW